MCVLEDTLADQSISTGHAWRNRQEPIQNVASQPQRSTQLPRSVCAMPQPGKRKTRLFFYAKRVLVKRIEAAVDRRRLLVVYFISIRNLESYVANPFGANTKARTCI